MRHEVAPELIAETRAFCAELEQLLAQMPAVTDVPVEQTRRARREGTGIFPAPVYLPEASTQTIAGPGGELPLRVIVPGGGADGVFLHIHGGGWTLGECDGQDPRLARLVADTGLAVVSVGYRLAPEHPYPAASDDCEAAALWVIEHREELGATAGAPLAIGGDSAGGHLAATTLLRMRDRHGRGDAFSAAVLQYGAFDLSMTPSQRLWGERNLVLSTPIIRWFGDQFLPGRSTRSAAIPTSPRCTRSCTTSLRRSSRSAPPTPCSTIRCSCPRAGRPRATTPSCACGRRPRTGSCRCR